VNKEELFKLWLFHLLMEYLPDKHEFSEPNRFLNLYFKSTSTPLSINYKLILGAIIGDIIGSVYEFHRVKNTDFEMFGAGTDFTDDTDRGLPAGLPFRWLEDDAPVGSNTRFRHCSERAQ
jgi:hypothetical protein